MAKGIYIETQSGDKYFFDAVLSSTYTQSGTPSQYAVESGVNVSDHYTQANDVVNIEGAVSAVKFIRNSQESTSLEEFEVGLTTLKKSGEFFSVAFSDNLSVLPNCLFTSLAMKRTTGTGRYAIDVSASIQQIIVGSRASIVTTPVAASEFIDTVEQQKEIAGNAVSPTEDEERRLINSLRDIAPDVAGGEVTVEFIENI